MTRRQRLRWYFDRIEYWSGEPMAGSCISPFGGFRSQLDDIGHNLGEFLR